MYNESIKPNHDATPEQKAELAMAQLDSKTRMRTMNLLGAASLRGIVNTIERMLTGQVQERTNTRMTANVAQQPGASDSENQQLVSPDYYNDNRRGAETEQSPNAQRQGRDQAQRGRN